MNRQPTRRPFPAFVPCVLLAAISPAAAGELKVPGMTLTVPEGFEVELVAGPPLVERPIVADFDEDGRLYVADSSGSNDKVEKQLEERPHRILRLEDTDGDGRFDRSNVFAVRMMFPEGAMWRDGSLYIGAPPSIWKLTDTDGDGVADQRQEWFTGKSLTGCANDLHGPYAGLDGRVYWTKGAFARQTHRLENGRDFTTRAAHIFRARLDGTGIEPVMTGGMDNPVDVVFTPEGDRVFTTTFFQHPEAGRRDGLVHAVYGGVYGKVHDVIDEHPRTGDVMPVLTHLGPAAPCGLVRYSSQAFGSDWEGSLFAALFNLHKVTRHVLEPCGASYACRDHDFLAGDNPDFHPTDVIEDADGSLLVVDTGGWYKICCPSSQLHKPDVLGAIYRVRRTGAHDAADPRGRSLDWGKLSTARIVALLGDVERPAVAARAIDAAAKRGVEAVPLLAAAMAAESESRALNAVWALTRVPGAAARSAVRTGLESPRQRVQLAAAASVSLWRDREAQPQLLEHLRGANARLARAAAEALGRIGAPEVVPALLESLAVPRERVLEHSLIFALIEIGAAEPTAKGLSAPSPWTQRAALIALDQSRSPLEADAVTPLLSAAEPALREAAARVASRHPEWAGVLAKRLAALLGDAETPAEERNRAEDQLAAFSHDAVVAEAIAAAARAVNTGARDVALRAMARARPKEAPASWTEALAVVVTDRDPGAVRLALAAALSLPAAKDGSAALDAALLNLATDATRDAETRLLAASAVKGAAAPVSTGLFAFLLASLDAGEPLAVRSAAAEILGRLRLGPEQLRELAARLAHVGPLEIAKILARLEGVDGEDGAEIILDALRTAEGFASLHPDSLRSRVAKLPARLKPVVDELAARLDAHAADQSKRLEDLTASLNGGDVRRGQAVFNGAKAACSTCHAIGYLGGRMGPDLTRIGQIRTERDLLESVIFPSASFTRSYESWVVVTRSGEAHAGILRKDAADEVIVAPDAIREVRVPRADVVDLRPGTVSVMPQGIETLITPAELADLIAFLKATRWGA